MQIIKNNDVTFITARVTESFTEDRTHFYLKFTDATGTNSVVLTPLNRSNYPNKYIKFLLENADGIPTGRGTLQIYRSGAFGLEEPYAADLVNTMEYELEAVSTFEIVQYYPEEIEFIYYKN